MRYLNEVVRHIAACNRHAIDLTLAFVLRKLEQVGQSLRRRAEKSLGVVVRPVWGEFEAAVDLLPIGGRGVQVSR